MVETMEIRKGYKQTEVGIIPSDWKVNKIDDFAIKVGSGITPTGGERVYKKEGRPFIRSQNVGWGNLILDDIAFIDDNTHNAFYSTEIQENDVFLNITGASIGRSAIADKKIVGGNVNQHVCIIRGEINKIESRYLNYYLLSYLGQKQINDFQAGGNRQGLNFGQIKSIQILLPPTKAEQTAIATALNDTDALISSLGKLIAKKRAIKQGAMQELLKPKDGWEVKKLGDVCDLIIDGTHYTPKYVDSGIQFYSVENVVGKNFKDTKFISVEEHKLLNKRCNPEKGDILLTRIGTLGITKLIDWNVTASIYVSLALLKVSKSIKSNYLNEYSKSKQFVKDLKSKALLNAAPPKINMQDIGKIEINLPKSKQEQIQIAQILSDMDTEIEALELKLEKYNKIKQGMMQNLLTGKIRLV